MVTTLRACLAIAVATCLAGCFDPKDQRPGLELRGEVVEQIPSDWSFTNADREIEIQVATPYWIPHSVTIWCAAAGDELYVGARNPDSKRWPGWVERDPNVQLRIGDRIYAVRLSRIDAADEIAQVRRAYVAKYDLPDPPPEGGPPMRYWRVEPRSGT
jgi:hypothetical protein